MADQVFNHSLFSGKNIVVVGASSGINLGIAERFSELGAQVAIISRNSERISSAAKQLMSVTGNKVEGYSADVRDYDALTEVLDQISQSLGEIDVLVSGAAGNFIAPLEDMSPNGFKSVVDIDLLGSFNVAKAALKNLCETGASIIYISAPQADHPYPAQAHVSAAKAGINLLTKSMAMEWGVKGIRVNAISPGPIDNTEGMKRLSPTEESKNKLALGIPLGRYGFKREIADLAVFLSSDAASYITGAVIPCDGGFTLNGAGAWNLAEGLPS